MYTILTVIVTTLFINFVLTFQLGEKWSLDEDDGMVLFLCKVAKYLFLCLFFKDYPDSSYYCVEDQDCKEFSGSSCINGTCVCENGSHCTETEGVKVNKIGEECGEMDTCSINNSTCTAARCACNKGYTESFSKMECLKSKYGEQGLLIR